MLVFGFHEVGSESCQVFICAIGDIGSLVTNMKTGF